MFLEVWLFMQAVGTVANVVCVVGLSLAVVFLLGYPRHLPQAYNCSSQG